MYELQIDCMRCDKTVYGQDWLSGGLCAKCNMEREREIREVQEQHRKNNETRGQAEKEIKATVEKKADQGITSCDYRNSECSNQGQFIDGHWVCSNHIKEIKQ